MPLKNTPMTTAGKVYGRPFDGPTPHFAQGVIDVTTLTTDYVDTTGYIKPGVPLRLVSAGVFGPITAAAQIIYGITPEAIKVAAGSDAASLAAASTTFPIGIVTRCQVRRGIIEDNLGRALTA